MAVDNSFGGIHSREKAEWMVEVTGEFIWDNWPGTPDMNMCTPVLGAANYYTLYNFFTVSVDEVEDYVGTIMDQEFDTLLEDGSLLKVFSPIEKPSMGEFDN